MFLFAQPYRERGLNERANGRPPLQATNFRKLDPAERVENPIDNRPRKTPDYRPPAEVFNREVDE